MSGVCFFSLSFPDGCYPPRNGDEVLGRLIIAAVKYELFAST
jgi:hypothetical protein